MDKEAQNIKQPWSMPQINEIEVKTTSSQPPIPPGNHNGKFASGNDAFSMGHES